MTTQALTATGSATSAADQPPPPADPGAPSAAVHPSTPATTPAMPPAVRESSRTRLARAPDDESDEDLVTVQLATSSGLLPIKRPASPPASASKPAPPATPLPPSHEVPSAKAARSAVPPKPVQPVRPAGSHPMPEPVRPTGAGGAAESSFGLPAVPAGDDLGSFGPFHVLGFLAKGGMGAVFKARDTRTGGICAVKVPTTRRVADPTELRRFQREARLAGKLKHPNICGVIDVGTADGRPYLALEFVDGLPLRKWVSRHGPTLEDVSRVVSALARAVEYANALGVVHRDIKPENIMVALPEGRPVLLDFGLARDPAEAENLTKSGICVGTPAYMAPEQAFGVGGPSALADVYGLGAVLYELLTGKAPYTGEPLEVLGQLHEGPPESPVVLNPEVPEPLARVCAKAMRRLPERRYQRAGMLADALDAVLAAVARAREDGSAGPGGDIVVPAEVLGPDDTDSLDNAPVGRLFPTLDPSGCDDGEGGTAGTDADGGGGDTAGPDDGAAARPAAGSLVVTGSADTGLTGARWEESAFRTGDAGAGATGGGGVTRSGKAALPAGSVRPLPDEDESHPVEGVVPAWVKWTALLFLVAGVIGGAIAALMLSGRGE